jgi:hypothetical protein
MTTPADGLAWTWETLDSKLASLSEACEWAEGGETLRAAQWEEWEAAGLQEVENAGSGSGLRDKEDTTIHGVRRK